MAEPARLPQPTVRQLRQARGWTQQDVAEQLGVDRDMVSRWERGERVPRARMRQRLEELFGVGVGEIAFGQMDEQP